MSNFYSLRISSLFFFYWCGLGLAAASSVPLSFSTYTATETELPASHADILNGPTGVKAVTALLDAIQLTWQPVAGASAYTLEVSARGAQGPFEPLVTLAGDRTSFRHSGLGSEQLLYYRIKAHGEGGESAYSAVVEGVSPGSLIRIMPLGDSNTDGGASSVDVKDRVAYRMELYRQLRSKGWQVDFVGSEQGGGNYAADFKEQHGFELDLDHAGFGGAQIKDIHNILDQGSSDIYGTIRGPGNGEPYLPAYRPNVILLHIGTNDASDSDATVQELEQVLERIDRYEESANSEVLVVLARIIDRVCHENDCVSQELRGVVANFNNKLEQMAASRVTNGDKLVVVDMYEGAGLHYWREYFPKPTGETGEPDFADVVHPNLQGYNKMANVWFAELDRMFTQLQSTSDEVAPDTYFAEQPEALSNSSTATFHFGSTEAEVTYQVSINGGAFTPRPNPFTLSGLTDGNYTLEVRAQDQAGNIDPTPAAHTWEVDTQAPAAPVVLSPADGATLQNTRPAISGTAEGESSVAVYDGDQLLGRVQAAADGSWTLALASELEDGTYHLTARATDAAGNTSPSSPVHRITIDTKSPETTIASYPDELTNRTTAAFTFSSDKEEVVYYASVDGASFVAVANPLELENLEDGEHVLQVRARDRAGNEDPTPATYTWTVDTRAPASPVVSAPANEALLNTGMPEFTGRAEAGSMVSIFSGEAQLGTARAAANGTWSFTPANAMAEGVHAVVARATDAAGNQSEASPHISFTIDTKAPETTIARAPQALLRDTDAVFLFESNETGVRYEVSLDGAAFGEVSNPYTVSELSEGDHTLRVRAVDRAGNTDGSPATHSWFIDSKAPNAPVLAGIDEDRGPFQDDQVTSDNAFVINGTAEANARLTLREGGAVLGETTADASGKWAFGAGDAALSQGTYRFTATATDAAGNTSEVSDALTVVLDLTAPAATLATAATSPTRHPFDIELAFSEEVHGLAAAGVGVVNGTLSNFRAIDGTTYTATVTPAADGWVRISLPAAAVTDLAGNPNAAVEPLALEFDGTRPSLVLATDAPEVLNAPFAVDFRFSEPVSGFEAEQVRVTHGEVADFRVVDASSYTALISPTADGEVTVNVAANVAFDAAGNGNTAAAGIQRTYDGQSPTVALSTGAGALTNRPFTVAIDFSEPVSGFEAADLSVVNGAASRLAQESDRRYTALITPVAKGEVKVAIPADKVQDRATNGNQASNELALFYDAERPAVVVSTEAQEKTNTAFTVTLSFSEEVTALSREDIMLENALAGDLLKVSPTAYTVQVQPAGDGMVSISLPENKVQDAAANGNMASNRLEVFFDATPPAGYAVHFVPELVDATNQRQVALEVSNAEAGATYAYRISSNRGGEEVEGTATVPEAAFTIPSLDLSGLHDGTLTVAFFLTDEVGNTGGKVTAQVEKLTRNVVAVEAVPAVKVPFRTAFEDVPLPQEVEVTYANGESERLQVSWERGNYSGVVPAVYSLSGNLVLRENSSNTNSMAASASVEVEPNQPPTAIALSATTFQPDIAPAEAIGTFSTTDPDDAEFSYELAAGEGAADNDLFVIGDGNRLYLRSNQGLSGKTSFQIRVRSTDPYQNSVEAVFTLTKTLYQPNGKIKLVNAFSPDGDGINDTWTVPELRYYNEVEIEVFDRSGIRLFHTRDPEQGWDGRGADGQVKQGSYFYIIQVKETGLVQKGVLTVIK